jgi:hypothetical protein
MNDLTSSLPNYLLPEYCFGVPPHSATSQPLLTLMAGGSSPNFDVLQRIPWMQQDSTNPIGLFGPSIGYASSPLQLPFPASLQTLQLQE